MKKRQKMKKMKNKFEKCRICDGSGVYEYFRDDACGGTHSIGVFECSFCYGAGKINILKEFKSKERINKMFKKVLSSIK